MSIKIYSGYDEFKYEEPEICDYIVDVDYENQEDLDESDDIFFLPNKKNNFIDSSTFYIVSDLEDEDNAEDISSHLGKFKRIYAVDFHKIIFCVD